jgi:lipoprotein-releasing system ATP-binding protein
MLEVQKVSKEYPTPGKPLHVLTDITFSLQRGESVSIVGPSGSGKSTLLYILGALEPPTSGTVLLDGTNPYEMNEAAVSAFRNQKIGFVFQDHHLLPQCTVLENVLVPTLVRPAEPAAGGRALKLLTQVGLNERVHHRPYELSGGEKQRVALARALINNPRLLLCDEPTGNLDRDSTEAVIALLLELHKRERNILVVVTHNLEMADRFSLKYRLSGTRLQTTDSSHGGERQLARPE